MDNRTLSVASRAILSPGSMPRPALPILGTLTRPVPSLQLRCSPTARFYRAALSPRVTFDSSTDNVNYTPLGNGIPQSGSSNWTLTGLSLSTGQNIYIRARGYYRGGYGNASESLTESVRNVFLVAGPNISGTI